MRARVTGVVAGISLISRAGAPRVANDTRYPVTPTASVAGSHKMSAIVEPVPRKRTLLGADGAVTSAFEPLHPTGVSVWGARQCVGGANVPSYAPYRNTDAVCPTPITSPGSSLKIRTMFSMPMSLTTCQQSPLTPGPQAGKFETLTCTFFGMSNSADHVWIGAAPVLVMSTRAL